MPTAAKQPLCLLCVLGMVPGRSRGKKKLRHSRAIDGCPCDEFEKYLSALESRVGEIRWSPAGRRAAKARINALRNKLGTDQRREKGRFV